MRLFTSSLSSILTKFKIRTGSLMVLTGLVALGAYAIRETNAHANGQGIENANQKYGAGCSCHCATSNSATTVTIASSSGSSPLTASPSTAYTFTVTVASSASKAGVEIASYSGSHLSTANTDLQINSSNELTHTAPKVISGGSATFTFTYTTGSSSAWDTLYATGNAVNGDNGNGSGDCSDKWNWSNKFIIHTVVPTRRIAFSSNTVAMGNLRINRRKATAFTTTGGGDQPISISSTSAKGGAPFSSYPNTSSTRILNPSQSETDSVIFSPTTRGQFTDSIIFLTNSDTVPQQRTGIYVTGTGIAPVYSATNGNALAFPNLRPSRTATLNFQYSNTGDDTLFFNSTPASITGSGFTVTAQPTKLALPPGQSDFVTVQFAPQAKQAYTGTLTLSASDGTNIPSVSLTGTGVLPQIQFTSPTSLGVTKIGTNLQGTITYRNTGTDTLHIVAANITQLSTKFSLGAFDAIVLAPTGTGTAHITYSPTAEMVDTGTLHLTTDDPGSPFANIAFSASGVVPHMQVPEKGMTINVGEVRVGSPAITRDFAVTNSGGADLAITNAVVGGAPFSVKSRPSIIAAGTTGYITVSFNPSTTGTFNDSLTIISDDATNPSGMIYLTGSGINSSLSISPSSLDFGDVPVATTVNKTITLANGGSASVSIYKYVLTSTYPSFAVVDSSKHTVAGHDSAHVTLSFHPLAAGPFTATLTLTTNDNSSPTRTINITGRGTQGALGFASTSLNFGTVKIGQDSTISVMLKNTGSAGVTLNAATLSGGGSTAFSYTGFTAGTLAAGDSQKINIMFIPAAPGGTTFSATLTVTTTDGTTPATVLLSGTSAATGGVKANDANNGFTVVLAPNPAGDRTSLNIRSIRSSIVDVRVFDAMGREQMAIPAAAISGDDRSQLVTTGLPNGTYFVRVTGSNGEVAETRLVIQR